MFFGQEVKTNQNKASALTMGTDIKLSQAVLDPASKGNKKEPVCLMAEIQGKSFILAVLDPSQSWQCPLDLMLAAGTEVKFYLRGQGVVHLTGYEFRDDDGDDDFEMSMSSDNEEEEEQSPDEAESKQPAKKLKVKNSPSTNGVKPVKMKPSGDDVRMEDSDDDDSSDEDLSFGSEDLDTSDDMDDVDLDELSSEEEGADDSDDDDDDDAPDEDDDDDDDDESD
jgi:hypothetical protein